MASASPETDIRILLIGLTGHGKSSTGNTIVGQEVFGVSAGAKSMTKTTKWSGKYRRFGRTVEVVDTPGFFDTHSTHDYVHKELLKALAFLVPGFHVIAFVLKRSRYTEELQKTQDLFFEWFGPGVEQFACLILTDTWDEKVKMRYIYEDPPKKLAQLVETCGHRVVAMQNLADNKTKQKQVRHLFEVAEYMKGQSNSEYFTNVAFQLAESYARNKCPQKLTNDSMKILRNAVQQKVLSENQIAYLDRMYASEQRFSGSEEGARDTDNKSERPATELTSMIENDPLDDTPDVSEGKKSGNLLIIDVNTNERISNTPSVQREPMTTAYPQYKRVATGQNTLSCSRRPDENQISDRIGVQSTTSGTESSNEINVLSDDSISDYTLGSTDVGCEQMHEAGNGESPKTPVDEFKERINRDENSEDVRGIFEYLKKAFIYCKRKVSGCSIL